MPSYLNTHVSIETMRQNAVSQNINGPRVSFTSLNNSQSIQIMIMGPPNSGKSALSRMLVSYAARLGRQPLLVDLDMAEVHCALHSINRCM
jgi:polyribonucleotide 5'-hydroxyl-kinase